MIKVLVVGNQSILLQGVKQVLAESTDIVPVLEARMGLDALEKVDVHALVDALIIVLTEAGMEIEPTLAGIHLIRPELPVLLLGASDTGLVPWDARSVGLASNSSPEQLVAEIRRLVRCGIGCDGIRSQEWTVPARATDERRAVHAED